MADRHHWSVAEAKARLSRVLLQARAAPQVIESRGRPVAVVLSLEAFEALEAAGERARPEHKWSQFLAFSQKFREEGGAELDLPSREPSAHRARPGGSPEG